MLDPLMVIDLRTTGLLKFGVSTDAPRAKAHGDGQALSEAVYGAFDANGLLYASRLTGAQCPPVYDRAVTGNAFLRDARRLVAVIRNSHCCELASPK